ncbi:LodA/GoxA family CTQ-dependent oxidase [Rhodovulum sp. DZ06]|uniref:LodA/GoxA family CTQ-dependent oxidase n=1 Tax=Rhodovulum sp. DZ06 TaxID=3425126 RepID=UPI003D352EF1
MTKTYAIHPALGIARIGNFPVDPTNPATFYLGAEAPYETPNEGKPYKVGGQVKKQGQRFRIYEYEDGVAVREVVLGADVQGIEWTVHLANRKSALSTDPHAPGVSRPGVPPIDWKTAETRNASVTGEDRNALAIDPGPITVSAAHNAPPGAPVQARAGIAFPDAGNAAAEANIGTAWAEPDTGRLLVFGGDGVSGGWTGDAFTAAAPVKQYANNDLWYDDSADGKITAKITFADGSCVTLDQPGQFAWVLCPPPKYTPGMGYYTTLGDVSEDVAGACAGDVSFMAHIYPVLRSVSVLQWVNLYGAKGHGPGKADFLQGQAMQQMSDANPDPNSDAYKARDKLFRRLRKPGSDDRSAALMPQVSPEVTDHPKSSTGVPFDIAQVTALQYARFEKWRDGDFAADYDPLHPDPYKPLSDYAVADQPRALDLGALDGSSGSPFFPGIESWEIARTPGVWAAPLRVSGAMKPGDMTMGNALPWQADFFDCNGAWWPVQRPTLVIRDGVGSEWTPPAWDDMGDACYNEMAENWFRLGFVTSGDGGASYAETERDPGLGA